MTTGRFKVGAWLVGEDRDTAFDGSTKVDNTFGERTRILVPLATFDVRLTGRMGLQVAATIPDVTRSAVIVSPAGVFNYRENFRGLGDTSVLAWYRLKFIRRWQPLLNLGVSLPTGRTETPRFRSELDDGKSRPDVPPAAWIRHR